MNSKYLVLFVAIVFIFSFLASGLLNRSGLEKRLDKISMKYDVCNPVKTICQSMLDGTRAELIFLQQPTALKPFEIEVRIDVEGVADVFIDFRMESMNMGLNYYRLSKSATGIWKGTAILPVCTSRRTDWIADLQIEYQGKLWTAEYSFSQSIEN